MTVKLRSGFWRIVLGAAMLFSPALACSSLEDTPAPPLEPTPTEVPLQAVTALPAKAGTWLVMLYLDADDSILEEDMFTDLNEAERVGSTDRMNLVAQIDRYRGGFRGKQDFYGAKRFLLQKDDDLEVVRSPELADLGEVNMADDKTLVDFATWAMRTYPADHYALILSDHGTGWPGGWSDADTESQSANIEINGFDDMLYLDELDRALAQIQRGTGVQQIDLIGMDACLMSSLEVMSALQPYAHYAVVSQESEPALGWAYADFLKKLARDPGADGAFLAKSIVDSYIDQDTLVVDDAARARYVSRTYETSGNVSAAELAQAESRTITLSAVDLTRLPALNQAVDDLAQAMSKINQKVVAAARTHAQAFDNVFGADFPPPYIDLGNFAKLVKNESTSERVGLAADAVRSAIKAAVIAEKHGPQKKGATGISIYFPNSKLFNLEGCDYTTYTRIAGRFSGVSLWDDFLTFHYTGQPLQANNKPTRDISAPVTEKITLDPIRLSGDIATTEKPVTLTSTVNGKNVAYIYIFTGRLGADNDTIQIVDLDYIDAEATREADGVVYPYWGEENTIPLSFDWSPVQYAINDGRVRVPALLSPDTYGTGQEDTLYTVEGVYHFADGEPDRAATLLFAGSGEMMRVTGYMDTNPVGPEREITPAQGDSFTVDDPFIVSGAGDTMTYQRKPGGTLTFGDTPWVWEEQKAPNGPYIVGFIVEDMDGSTYDVYAGLAAR